MVRWWIAGGEGGKGGEGGTGYMNCEDRQAGAGHGQSVGSVGGCISCIVYLISSILFVPRSHCMLYIIFALYRRYRSEGKKDYRKTEGLPEFKRENWHTTYYYLSVLT